MGDILKYFFLRKLNNDSFLKIHLFLRVLSYYLDSSCLLCYYFCDRRHGGTKYPYWDT